MRVQILILLWAFGLFTTIASGNLLSDDLYVDVVYNLQTEQPSDQLLAEDPPPGSEEPPYRISSNLFNDYNNEAMQPNHYRMKRSVSKYLKHLEKTVPKLLASNSSRLLPPTVKHALESRNFSTVTARDFDTLDLKSVDLFEPQIFRTMSPELKNHVIDVYLKTNRPTALARFLDVCKQDLDLKKVLEDKIRLRERGQRAPNEAELILIYVVAAEVLGNATTDQRTIALFIEAGVLRHVPEELFMKVKNAHAARTLLTTLYNQPLDAQNNNIDDKSLISHLVTIGYGPPSEITTDQFDNLASKFYASLPAEYLKNLASDVIKSKLNSFRDVIFGSQLQRKSIVDNYLRSIGIETNNVEGAKNYSSGQKQRYVDLSQVLNDLGSFACFINPSFIEDDPVRVKILDSCGQLGLNGQVQIVRQLLERRLRGNPIERLKLPEFRNFEDTLLFHSPPSIIRQAVYTHAITRHKLETISHRIERNPSSGYLQGLVQQLTEFTAEEYKRDITSVPPSFLSAISIKQLLDRAPHEDQVLLGKVNRSEDALGEVQKGVLVTKLLTQGILELDQTHATLPPALASVLPRSKPPKRLSSTLVQGLPSESDLRLAYAEQFQTVTLDTIVQEPLLVGTLTPKQAAGFDLNDMPELLSLIRNSADGPSSATLKTLANRYGDYIRAKSDITEKRNSKLLKYVTPAELSRLPATVLAYFVAADDLDLEQKLELMIALGTCSTKDHALIPKSTREWMVSKGLEAMEKQEPATKSQYDLRVLTLLAHGVADLPPAQITRLTPAATELALDLIQGQVDDDDDGLRQRACLSPQQRSAWRNKVIQIYGETRNWTPLQVQTLCCSLGLLEESDLRAITPESLVNCRCAADSRPPSHLKNLRQALNGACAYELGRPDSSAALLNRIRAEQGLKIPDLGAAGGTAVPGRRGFFKRSPAIQTGDGAKHVGSHATSEKKHHHHYSNHLQKRSVSYTTAPDNNMDFSEQDPPQLHCTTLRLVQTAAAYSTAVVNTFWEKEIRDCLWELGREPLSIDSARLLWNKLVNMHNKMVANIPPDLLRKAGYILRGITKADVDQLEFSSDDVVAPLGVNLGLSKALLEYMSAHLTTRKNKQWNLFNAYELIVAGNIICGADLEQLRRLDTTAFRNALPHLKSLHQDCDPARLAVLANLTKSVSVYGDVKNWTAADVRSLGMLFIGLTSADIEVIPPEAFLGLPPSVAANLLPPHLQAINVKQMEHVPRFSLLAMRAEQIAELSSNVKDVFEEGKRGSQVSRGCMSSWSWVTAVVTMAIMGIRYNLMMEY